MKEQLPGNLFGEFEPEQAPLHEIFLDALNEVTALKTAGTITEEDYDLAVRYMAAAVIASEFDSMIVDFFSRSHTDDGRRPGPRRKFLL